MSMERPVLTQGRARAYFDVSVRSCAEGEPPTLEEWHSKMQTHLDPSESRYAKAVARIAGRPACFYDAVQYQDENVLSHLGLSTSDWTDVLELAYLSHTGATGKPPDKAPDREAIRQNISENRQARSRSEFHERFALGIADLYTTLSLPSKGISVGAWSNLMNSQVRDGGPAFSHACKTDVSSLCGSSAWALVDDRLVQVENWEPAAEQLREINIVCSIANSVPKTLAQSISAHASAALHEDDQPQFSKMLQIAQDVLKSSDPSELKELTKNVPEVLKMLQF